MDAALRRLVAFTAGAVVSGHQAEGVFDFETGSRFPVAGSMDGDIVEFRDETDGASLAGTLPHLRQGDGTALELHLEDDEFEGRDAATGAGFRGRVSGRNIDLTDDAAGDEFTYCL